jgi:hypothetical protein
MTRNELASLMNVNETDLDSFINCLRVWTNKGLSLEDAIDRHMTQMKNLVTNSTDRRLRDIAVESYDELRTA